MTEPQVTMSGPAQLRHIAKQRGLPLLSKGLNQLADDWDADRAALERARALLSELASCEYECIAGRLVDNVAYQQLAAALAEGGRP